MDRTCWRGRCGRPAASKPRIHRGDDHVLAVDQRAVDIENDKFHGSSAKGSSGTSCSDQPSVCQVRAIWSGKGAVMVISFW